jgi:hypothetical protein
VGVKVSAESTADSFRTEDPILIPTDIINWKRLMQSYVVSWPSNFREPTRMIREYSASSVHPLFKGRSSAEYVPTGSEIYENTNIFNKSVLRALIFSKF